jgi:hypothetical protein
MDMTTYSFTAVTELGDYSAKPGVHLTDLTDI